MLNRSSNFAIKPIDHCKRYLIDKYAKQIKKYEA